MTCCKVRAGLLISHPSGAPLLLMPSIEGSSHHLGLCYQLPCLALTPSFGTTCLSITKDIIQNRSWHACVLAKHFNIIHVMTDSPEPLRAGAAAQFFCEVPSQSGTSGELGLAGDTYDECVYREDTLVLLELTTRDMMEVRLLLPLYGMESGGSLDAFRCA